MVRFEQAITDKLCGILDELKKIYKINETWEKRETTDIAFFTLPENGGVRSFAIGTTKINFKTGVIVNPDSTKEYMNRKLDMISQEWLHSISVDSNQDLKLKILPNSIRSVDAYFSTQIPYLNYNEIEITCTVATNIKIFACTNPSAVVGQYKNPMTDVDGRMVVSSISQLNVEKDVAEAPTWDATLTSLLSNLNRIRYAIVTMSGEAWGTFSHTIGSLWAKFNATTGHAHTGSADDGPKISINSLSEVTILSPGADQLLKYDGSKWINSTLNVASAGSGVVYYFTDAASDLATFEVLSKVPDTAAEVDESQSVTNTTTEFERYASPSGGLGGTAIDTGLWTFNIYAYVSDAADLSELLVNVYSRNVAGAETLLFSLTTGNIDALATTLYQIVSVQPAFSITATDRLVVRVSAKTNSASAKTVHFIHSGTTHGSNIITPLVIRHNELIGLQGGSSTERYHMTSAQNTKVAAFDHVDLANKGTNTHAQIDTAIGSLAATYAPIAKGVTNGDSHDHNGGDGAQIDHVNLASKGTNTHAQIDAHIAATSVITAYNSYTGNGATNRAIAHGLGVVPKFVTVLPQVISGTGVYLQLASTIMVRADDGHLITVTAWDATNFYVTGDYANVNAKVYNWRAEG